LPVLVTCALLMAGCATSPREAGADITGGLTLDMFLQLEAGSMVRYRVDRDGVLSFAGGFDARNEKYTWSGPMTEAEITQLLALLDAHRWLERDPPSPGEPDDRRCTVTVHHAGKRNGFKVIGAEASVDAIAALLESAASRRHEEFLQSLPRPGERQ
jgi:hypothetical protein